MGDTDTTRTMGRRASRSRASRLPSGWPWVLAAVIALAGTGAGSRVVGEYEWDNFIEFRSIFRFEDLPPAEPTPPLTERLVIVVIDGLRTDVARDLPTFDSLSTAGSFLVARTGLPSLSLPGWTSISTGAPPFVSGVTTNWYEGPVLVDSLFASAQRAGLTTAVAGSGGWRQLFGEHVDASYYATREDTDAVVGRRAVRILEESEPNLLVVHLVDTDTAGHDFGVGDEYRAAAQRADRIVGQVVEAAGEDASIVVTSDHGHVDEGGHGGSEADATATPVALAGEGFTLGASGEISQSDLAPTLAALLGVGRPSHSTGALRLGLLDADEEDVPVIEAAHQAASSRFHARATGAFGDNGDTAEAFRAALDERASHDLIARLPFALVVAIALAAAVSLATHKLDGPAMALGVIVFLGLLIALFFGRGFTLTFSMFHSEEQVRSFLTARFFDGLIAGAGAGLVTGLTAGRRGWTGSFQAGLGTAAWSILVLSLGVLAFLTIYGWAFTWRVPNLSAAFAQYLGLLSMSAAGIGAALIGLLSLGSAWGVSRGRP